MSNILRCKRTEITLYVGIYVLSLMPVVITTFQNEMNFIFTIYSCHVIFAKDDVFPKGKFITPKTKKRQEIKENPSNIFI